MAAADICLLTGFDSQLKRPSTSYRDVARCTDKVVRQRQPTVIAMKLNFIPDPNFKPKRQFDLIPTDDYVVMIIGTEQKKTKGGHALNLTFQVLDGPYKNRRFWVMLNIDHYDDAVQQRAYNELHSLCKALNITDELTTEALCNKALTARVYESKAKDGFEAKNSARNFRPSNWLYPPELVSIEEPKKHEEPVAAPAPVPTTASAKPMLSAERARELYAQRRKEAEELAKTMPF